MAINEDHRQAEIAAELEQAARVLAHSTRTVPVPSDSYRLLGELNATTDHLSQVCQQLATWHDGVADGTHYEGEDDRGDGATGTVTAAEQLRQAASALADATQAIMAAHSANGVVRWYDAPKS
ncbi:hypothetical protein GCM10010977_32280 [Citricoccus zhacaiensis]|uniref:WXG100 family type VII secretion target n=1 Tax=Citricoccus zhacaiensis TaxID=489142 RepID=A0ABQ2MCG2_9MICC|nr:hypothetical protein [Citricoccus zhacaiensis]GGO49723.1 hypothetical protein GCM10010977_32280 [Citricoccus zhacaiensis]